MKMKQKLLMATLSAVMALQCAPVYAAVSTSSIYSTSSKSKSNSQTKEVTELTVESATEKAIKNNSAIKKSMETEDLSDENIQNLKDAVYDATTDASSLSAESKLMAGTMSRSLNLKDIAKQKENVHYEITKYFNSIIDSEKALELYDKNMVNTKKDLDILELKTKLGLASQLDYDTAKLAYDKAAATRATTVSAIDAAYRNLNSYMGTDLDLKYDLTVSFEYKEIQVDNLTNYAEKFVTNSLAVQEKKDALEVARFELDNYVLTFNPTTGLIVTGAASEDSKTVAFNTASRSYEDTKKTVKETVISTYTALKDAETIIKTQIIDIDTLKQDLAIAQKKLELGQTTQLDVDKIIYNIDAKEEALRKAKNSHSISVIAFNNPNLLSGA